MSSSFEWDEAKRQLNISVHGVDLIRGKELFDGRPVYTYPSPRNAEERWATVGWLDDRLFIVVWTWRSGRRRLISLYRADEKDERDYRQRHGRGH